jgi:hypothetical protein
MMIRWIATVLNAMLIAFLAGLNLRDDVTQVMSTETIFFEALMMAAPIASLLAIWLSGAEGWISLIFRRKALEEEQRIDQLSNGSKRQ